MIISPYDIALYYLEVILEFDFTSEANEAGELSAEQTKALKSAGLVDDKLIVAVNSMLRDLSKSDNKIDFTANLKNKLTMNLAPVVVETVSETLTNGSHIKWTASHAHEIDPIHALNYGKVMTWGTAKKKGLGTRPNCKCGFEVVNHANLKPIERNLTIDNKNILEKTQ